ncbi:MAG TPA: hypothetical protein VFD87_10985, partial [Phototrophicaceae bacterium]|nr:hypothetical protein [Phototrophicaceae bacterium]
MVTHGLFMPGSAEVVRDTGIDHFVTADSVPPFRLQLEGTLLDKLTILRSAGLFGECIRRLHQGLALDDLTVL